MRIEFVGLPAAGKTHACRTAHAALRRRGIAARLDCVEEWRPQLRRLLADYLSLTARGQQGVRVSTSAAWLLRHAVGRTGVGALQAVGACAYLVAVDAHVRTLEPAAAWLHDQGTVQALWSVSMRSGADVADVVAGYEARISWPGLVVEVQAPLPTIVDRLEGRRATPTSVQAGEATGLRESLEEGEATTATLRRLARQRSVAWLENPGVGDLGESVAAEIQRALR